MTIPVEAVKLLEESAEWRLLGLLFEYPANGWRAQVESLLPSLARADLRSIADEALTYHSEGLHTALFGPAGTAPVREVTHKGGVQSGYLMAELAAFYDAFDYRPESVEADDHLSVQLGFLAFLKMKQAAALLAGSEEDAAVTESAAATFLKEHIALQAEPVAGRLELFGPDYLIAASQLILQYAGPSPRSGYPLTGIDDDEEMTCGPAAASTELVQLS